MAIIFIPLNIIAKEKMQCKPKREIGGDTVIILKNLDQALKYHRNNKDTALYFAKKALEQSEKLSYCEGQIKSWNWIGIIYGSQHKYPLAIDAYEQVEKISEFIGDKMNVCVANHNIGLIYQNRRYYEKALEYFLKSYDTIKDEESDFNITISLISISACYIESNQLKEALDYGEKAYKKAESLSGDFLEDRFPEKNQLEGIAIQNLGEIYFKKDSLNVALCYYKKAISKLLIAEDYDNLGEVYSNIGRLYYKKNEIDSCIYYLNLGINSSIEYKNYNNIIASSSLLKNIYKNDKDSVIKYLTIYADAKDDINNDLILQETEKALVGKELRDYEKRKIEEEIKKKREEEEQNTMRYLLIFIFIILFFVSLFIMRKNISKRSRILISYMGLLATLLLYEYVLLLIHPFIGHITGHHLIYMFFIMVLVGAILVYLHHRLDHFIQKLLIRKAIAKNTITQDAENQDAIIQDTENQDAESQNIDS